MLSGCGPMKNADECRRRAEKCLAAAQHASDRDAQRTWHQLSDMWLLWSGQLVQLRPENNGRSEATDDPESGKRPTVVTEPIAERAISRRRKAAEMADLLRLRLALTNDKQMPWWPKDPVPQKGSLKL
jgi:hypothetical protein